MPPKPASEDAAAYVTRLIQERDAAREECLALNTLLDLTRKEVAARVRERDEYQSRLYRLHGAAQEVVVAGYGPRLGSALDHLTEALSL